MTNYTYEQKKVIAEYLKNKVLPRQHKIEDQPDDNFNTGYYSVIDSSVIDELISDLTSYKFSDIKHQVGTKFKCGDFGSDKYAIGFDAEYQCYQLINLDTFKISDLSIIEGDELVEVINETKAD